MQKKLAGIIILIAAIALLWGCASRTLTVTELASSSMLLVGVEKTEYVFSFSSSGFVESLTMKVYYTSSNAAESKYETLGMKEASLSGKVISCPLDYSDYSHMERPELKALFEANGFEAK
ncbi:MAG: hypothetical protein FWG30_05785 [Eubacteriaceae bacterium]|nr:hypothetical protein [Eubacteriaceae bacterium]